MTDYTNINKTIKKKINNTMNYYTTVTKPLKILRNTMKYYTNMYKTIEHIEEYYTNIDKTIEYIKKYYEKRHTYSNKSLKTIRNTMK